MRLATYNVENMFERARAMNLTSWAEGRPILNDYQRLNELSQVDLGFDGRRIITGSVRLPAALYQTPGSVTTYWDEFKRRLQTLPAVAGVAFVDSRPPDSASNFNNFELEDFPPRLAVRSRSRRGSRSRPSTSLCSACGFWTDDCSTSAMPSGNGSNRSSWIARGRHGSSRAGAPSAGGSRKVDALTVPGRRWSAW